MGSERFWAIIQASKDKAAGDPESQVEGLREELTSLSPSEIVEFQQVWDGRFDTAHRWELWGAAYIMGGGCSDDGFLDFRSWLIMQGQSVYENAIRDPETLANVVDEEDGDATQVEGPQYVAAQVWSEKTGKPTAEFARRSGGSASEPTGEPWSEEGGDLERRFPKLWKKFGYQ